VLQAFLLASTASANQGGMPYHTTASKNLFSKMELNPDEIICLDVGGEIHYVKRGLLARFPSTRLGRVARAKNTKEAMEHCSIFYDKKVPEFFFDRNPANFSAILGKLVKIFCQNCFAIYITVSKTFKLW